MTGKNFKFSVLSYFFISFILGGLQRLSGLFVLELLQSMSVSRQNAVVPFTFSWAVANIMASFSNSLRESRKLEYVILFGIILTATGAALCIFATNITTLIAFWGFIFGSGYGIAFPHISRHATNVNCNKLSFLLQVAPNLGVTVLPFVLHMLTSCYGLQGSYLIISGIILNYLPLSVAAAYNIKLRLPNWRVRKKNSQYVVSKQDRGNIVSVESFVNSLEPDLILTISTNDESKDENYRNTDNSVVSTKEAFVPIQRIGRKRSETRGYDLPGLETGPRMFHRKTTHSAITDEMLKYENKRNIFEDSFSNKDIITSDEEKNESKSNCIINCDISNTTKISEKNILTVVQTGDSNLKNEQKLSESNINVTLVVENEPDVEYLAHATEINNCKQAETAVLETVNENTVCTSFTKENESKQNIGNDAVSQTHTENKEVSLQSSNMSKTQEIPKSNDPKHNSPLKNEQLKIPVNIKVHVEEYTFICEGESWHENLNTDCKKKLENNYRNHSNSLLSEIYANIDFTNPKVSKNLIKSSDLYRSKLSSIYSISENSEYHSKEISEEKNIKEKDPNKCLENSLKVMSLFKFINEITSPGCLCIILINIIFEINLITLITMFADFGNNIDNHNSNFKWILAAFGVGGIAGKFCCCKISRTIPEKSHAIGVILFLLTGLSTAGVLFSTNLNWLAGFYAILGALEGGITYIIPKFILEYIDRNMHSMLYSVKSFLSGIALIFIPYGIGLCRDELGDYEFLLQTLSCSSILCALLVYLLPCLSFSTEKRYPASFKDKIEMA